MARWLTDTMKELACHDGEFQVDHINQAAGNGSPTA